MSAKINPIQKFLLDHIPQHPNDIVAFAAKKCFVTRMTIHRHLKTLLQANKIIKTGTTKNTRYHLSETNNRNLSFKITVGLDESTLWIDYFKNSALKNNLDDILHYGFTEMFNNAIDHSQGSRINASIHYDKDYITMTISDNGIGIFEKIKRSFCLIDYQSALLTVSLAKNTTDPSKHSGQGIFFTSRMFDIFTLQANNITYIKNNVTDDWSVDYLTKTTKGTNVILQINPHTTREINTVFGKYTNTESGNFEFDKTETLVKLADFNRDKFIARSEAKMIVASLKDFAKITFDFRDVRLVGQGFVDEIFRVYQNRHPHVILSYVNANENVRFMIERGLPRDQS